MKNLKYKILFTVDSDYLPHFATALYSLFLNNISLHFEIVLFTAKISESDKFKINKICLKYDAILNIIVLDEKHFEGLIISKHFKVSNYFRLYAADFIDGDKCLYLDSDVIINGSIKNLYEQDIQNFYLAAVEDPAYNNHKELGLKPNAKYFNSGVMLLNLKKLRDNRIRDKVLNFVKTKSNVIKYVDQCGLNAVINGDWLELNAEYNCQSYMLLKSNFSNYFKSIRPVIIHYTGSSKPWQFSNIHPFKYKYWYYRVKVIIFYVVNRELI
ncbi:glycosyltransferase family 8 protein [Aquirufa sp. 2-AUSEE-184A6]|uniref:Glycosyltransferase family 8 protein n=1 Tax=Aquirufa novilacunae TaxID=3139305 RepID=A0ABW8SYM8_9BACT